MDESHSTAPADDARVVAYWHRIAPEWTHSIRTGGIPSRTLVTNRAIVDAVLERSPASVLDIGCGEGWLCREIAPLHPVLACGDEAYVDGWRRSPWTGISADMTDPSPWYFRTLGTWIQLFGDSSLRLVDLREPLHPETGQPASVIFILEPVPM